MYERILVDNEVAAKEDKFLLISSASLICSLITRFLPFLAEYSKSSNKDDFSSRIF